MKPFPPNPDSQQSTISTVEREIREAGGDAHAISADVRDFDSVTRMVDETVKVRSNCFCRSRYVLTLTRNMVGSMLSSITPEQYGGLRSKLLR